MTHLDKVIDNFLKYHLVCISTMKSSADQEQGRINLRKLMSEYAFMATHDPEIAAEAEKVYEEESADDVYVLAEVP
ncbi:MAG: hypothetical protein ACREGR_00375 [Minisyncoccia bacterium]